MKVPLIIPNEAREDSRAKDSWGINCFLEREDANRAVKRPGLVSTVDGLGTVGQGVFIWPNGPEIVVVVDDQLLIVVNSVHIGDIVSGYYAMVDDPSTTPGPGDPYWSVTPPGANRWRGIVGLDVSYGMVAAVSPEGSDYLFGPIAASKEAAAKAWVEVVIGARLSGVAVLNTYDGFDPDYVIRTVTFNSFPSYTYNSGNDRIEMSINAKEVVYSGYPGSWPSGASYTGLITYSDWVGLVAARLSLPSFTITSSGTTGKITSLYLAGPYNLIEISGADQPEYNGVFFAKLDLSTVTPWDTVMDEWIFTLPGVPAASPATGTIVVYAY